MQSLLNGIRAFIIRIFSSGTAGIQDVTAYGRAVLVNVMTISGAFFCTIYCVYSFSQGETILALVDCIVDATFIGIFIYFHKTKNYTVAGSFGFLCCGLFFLYLILSGGSSNSGHLWSFIFPIVALFLFGPTRGLAYSFLYLIAASLLLFGVSVFPNHPVYALTFKLRFIGSYICVLIVAYLYEMMRTSIHRSTEAKNTELSFAIGDLMQAEEALRSSEKRLKDILLSSSDWIWESDTKGVYTYIGGRIAPVLGYTAEELLGKEIISFVPRDSAMEFKNRLEAAVKQKTPLIDFTVEHLHKKGYHLWMLINAVPVIDATGQVSGLRGINKNITAQKRAESDRAVLEEKFRTSQKMEAIGQLAGGIAHDFNNILGAISGYAEMIRTRFGEHDSKLKKYTDNILSASSRAADLTGKLLAFARRGKFQNIPFNIQHTVTEVTELLRHSVDKRVEVIVTHHAENAMVQGDPMQIQNALMNLGINGADAMPDGGKLVFDSVNVQLDARFIEAHHYDIAPGEYVLISVIDTGTGMDEDTKAHLFQPFFTTKELGKGTGLGLASVYGTIKSHSGYINVYSEQDKGTAFKIYLPCAYASPEKGKNNEGISAITPAHGITIMLVDDEQFLLDISGEMLEMLGYSTVRFRVAAEAVAYFREHSSDIHLAIIDMNMPELNGRDCFKLLRQIHQGFRAILTTGLNLDHELQEIRDEGFCGVLEKPFIASTLARAVAQAIQSTGTGESSSAKSLGRKIQKS